MSATTPPARRLAKRTKRHSGNEMTEPDVEPEELLEKELKWMSLPEQAKETETMLLTDMLSQLRQLAVEMERDRWLLPNGPTL